MSSMPEDLTATVDAVARSSGFAGAVRVDVAGDTVLAVAYGHAHRGLGVANRVDTMFAMASGSKTFTACAVLALADDAMLDLDEPVRRWLGDDLPEVAANVTARHLLAHRSGIGDYLDEGEHPDVTMPVMPAPVHTYDTTEAFLPTLAGRPTVFVAGERFAYCNGGYVVLALVAERASGRPFHDLVAERVLRRAGLRDTGYVRTDSLPGRAAAGYLHAPDHADALRTNVLHLPVRGNGDGGAFTTVADVAGFWSALDAGRIVRSETVRLMTTATTPSDGTGERFGYGLGLWLESLGDGLVMEGYDAGVSFRSLHRPSSGLTWTVVSNWSDGAWPVARALHDALPPT